MRPLLLNIRRVYVIETRRLANMTFVDDSRVLLNYWRDLTELPLVGIAKCEAVSKVGNKSRLVTVTLSARLSGHFNVGNRRLAFIIETVAGDRYLVGKDSAPFAVVSTTDLFPDSVTEPSGCTLTAELTDIVGIWRILDWF